MRSAVEAGPDIDAAALDQRFLTLTGLLCKVN